LIGKLKGKTLEVSVQAAGIVKVADAADKSARSARKKKSLGLKLSSASGGAGTIKAKLKLTSAAGKTLKRSGKVKLEAKITFTPILPCRRLPSARHPRAMRTYVRILQVNSRPHGIETHGR
jgi:hypothetical protein